MADEKFQVVATFTKADGEVVDVTHHLLRWGWEHVENDVPQFELVVRDPTAWDELGEGLLTLTIYTDGSPAFFVKTNIYREGASE